MKSAKQKAHFCLAPAACGGAYSLTGLRGRPGPVGWEWRSYFFQLSKNCIDCASRQWDNRQDKREEVNEDSRTGLGYPGPEVRAVFSFCSLHHAHHSSKEGTGI